jgi:ubiquinone/menaquinone biosynthesis C-methylase UbiE
MSFHKESARGTLDFKGKVEAAYDVSAETYDDAMRSVMVSCANLLIRNLQIPENPTVLDVGCGTGILTFELVKKVQGKGKFYGIDISPKMIHSAKARAESLGHANVEFRKADAEQLDFLESSFDLVISNQAFHWFPDKEKALKEMFRVLKHGGRVALTFQGWLAFKEMTKAYDRVRNSHPEYGMPDLLRLMSLEETQELFDRTGFQRSRIYAIHQVDYVNPSDFRAQRDATASSWRVSLPLEMVEKAQKEIHTEMAKLITKKGLKTTIYNIFAYAQKP